MQLITSASEAPTRRYILGNSLHRRSIKQRAGGPCLARWGKADSKPKLLGWPL
jgi:hypothetical protein